MWVSLTMVNRDHFPFDFCRIFNRSINPKVRHILIYIDQYYSTKKIVLNDLASLVNIHPDYLSRIFRKETGVRLHDYLLLKRIQMSVTLLRDPKKSIKKISNEVGFSCPEVHSKVFKRLTHCSPKTYRTRTFS